MDQLTCWSKSLIKQKRPTVFVILLCILSSLPTSSAAQRTKKQTEPKLDTELQQRRAIAISMLQSLAIEARSYRDEVLRARVQARIADLLWTRDKEAARALFQRAWEVAEALDQAGASASAPGRRSTGSRPRSNTNLRREIIQLASRRDHALGEAFLARLTNKDSDNSSTVSSSEITERLQVAGQILATNNVELALRFADPALIVASERTILFLVELRNKNAAAADERFARLLLNADRDPGSDANTVSFLTSYIFTPSFYLVVSPTGIPSSNSYPPRAAPEVSPALRKRFFGVAARILLRPLTDIDRSSAGRPGTHFIAARLVPLFQQFAPEFVAPINAQLASMGAEVARATSNTGDYALNRGMNENGRTSAQEELEERLDRAKNTAERDRAYAFAAMRAADAADPQAHDLVDKIEDEETRKGVKTFVNYSLMQSLIRNKRGDEAVILLRKADLPYVLRAHFLIAAGALILKNDQVRAIELFSEALADSRRLDQAKSERAYLLLAALRQFSTIDNVRTWELLTETITAANRVTDFTGENSRTVLSLEGKFSINLTTELAAPSDLADVFELLARDGFYQALDAAKTFTGDAPKAIAMIAIARAVLDDSTAKPH